MAAELAPLPYLEAMVAYLREREPKVWEWYGSTQVQSDQAAAVRLELLKATVRLEREAHGTLYDSADRVRAALGLDIPVTFYQAIGRTQANASLVWLPGEAHLVLQGDVLEALDEREREAMIGHELGHARLWQEREGAFFRAARILSDMVDPAGAEVSVQRSEAIYGQHCEVYCDRASLLATGALDPVVSCLVKVETGLRTVDPAGYVRQADEIFGMERPTTQGLSHPEIYIRVRALAEWHRGSPGVGAEIERMLAGPFQLERPALLDQVRAELLTRDVIRLVLEPAFMRSETVQAHARLFFPDADLPGSPEVGRAASAERLGEELAGASPSLQDYVSYLLLDFAAADTALGEVALAHALSLAEALGLRARFEEKAVKELKLSRKRLAALREDGKALLARAAAGGPAP
jgi:Zn-dependent protease with chaperone function